MLKNSFFLTASNILQVIMSMMTGIIVARGLGVESKGDYYLITQTASFLLVFIQLGFGPAIVYSIKEKLITYSQANLFSAIYLFTVSFFLLFFTLCFNEHILSFLGNKFDSLVLIITLITTILNLVTNLFANKLKSTDKGYFYTIIISFISSLSFLLMTGGLFYFSLLSLRAILIILLIKAFILTILTLFGSIKENNDFMRIGRYECKIFFRKSILFFLSSFFLTSLLRIDVFFLNLYCSSRDIGIYSVGVNLAELLTIVPGSIGAVFFVKMMGENELSRKQNFFFTSKFILYLSVLSSTVVVLTAPFIINLAYGPSFHDSYISLVLLIPGTIAMCLNYSLINFLSGIGKPEVSSVLILIGMLINIILNIMFIPIYGYQVASISSSISYILLTTGFLLYIKKFNEPQILEIFIFRSADFQIIKKTLKKHSIK